MQYLPQGVLSMLFDNLRGERFLPALDENALISLVVILSLSILHIKTILKNIHFLFFT